MGGSNKNEINAILNSVEVKVEVLDELGSESFSLWTEEGIIKLYFASKN